MLTQERLKELFHYEPETGNFIRLVRTAYCTKVGDIAGSIYNGYAEIKIDNKNYKSHRLAFLYMNGKWPEKHVDHIDGIRSNNKWLNLRECNESQNAQNRRKAASHNKTGLLGVSPSTNKNGTFVAYININGKSIYLGSFKTPEQAHQEYLDAKRNNHEFNTI